MRLLLSSLFLALPLCVRAHADSYAYYCASRTVSSDGRYYVVIRPQKGIRFDSPVVSPFTLTVAEVQPGSLPVQPYLAQMVPKDGFYEISGSERVVIRDGDHVLGKCTLNALPGHILISTSGLGVVALDLLPFNNHLLTKRLPDAVIVMSLKGEILFRKSLFDLYGEQATQFRLIFDGRLIQWLYRAWIDEARHEVVIFPVVPDMDSTSKSRWLRIVSLDDGKVRVGTAAEIVQTITDAISARNFTKLSNALDVAMFARIPEARNILGQVIANELVPLVLRIQGVVLQNELGDHQGNDLLVKVTLGEVRDERTSKFGDARYYAESHLAVVLGEQSLPILREVIKRNGERIDAGVESSLIRLGKSAIPILIEMRRDSPHTETRDLANRLLLRIKAGEIK